MGLNLEEIEHLNLAGKQGLGVKELEKIEIKGENINQVKTEFKLPKNFKSK
jgi:hypothetical protein